MFLWLHRNRQNSYGNSDDAQLIMNFRYIIIQLQHYSFHLSGVADPFKKSGRAIKSKGQEYGLATPD